MQMEATRKYEEAYRGMLTKSDRDDVAKIRDYIRKEFLQPAAMDISEFTVTAQSRYDAQVREKQPVEPVRYKIETIDDFDINLAILIGTKVNEGPYAAQADAIMREYGHLKPDVQ